MKKNNQLTLLLNPEIQGSMDSRKSFFILLKRFPKRAVLWDKEINSLKVEAFEKALGVMSHGEVQLAKFFAPLWFNNNEQYGFDVIDAVAHIDADNRKLIAEWITNPFWP